MKAPAGWLREKGRQQSEVVDIVCLGEKQVSGYRISRSTCRTSGDCFCRTEEIVMLYVDETVTDFKEYYMQKCCWKERLSGLV